MKPYILLLLLPLGVRAQRVTKIIEPVTGQSWWITNKVNIGTQGRVSPLSASFRSSTEGTLLYLNPTTMEEIGTADFVVIVTTTDTVVARSTAVQPANESTYTREYRVSREDLYKLAKSPLLKVTLTSFSRAEVVMVPEKDRYNLMRWVKALLQVTAV